MDHQGRRTGGVRWLAVFLLMIGMALGAHAAPPTLKVPGRKPDSNEPWGAFLGKAAHFAIGRQYSKQYPRHVVFLDPATLLYIVERGQLGNPQHLSEFVRLLRPDITDTTDSVLFEIKLDNEESRMQGRVQARRYIAALNAAVEAHQQFSGGTGFEGSLFLEFENGGALWELSWRTPEPGVTLYHWSSRQKKPNASWKERVAQREEALTREEGERLGELAEQVIRVAYEGGEWPKSFQGQVYLPVDCR